MNGPLPRWDVIETVLGNGERGLLLSVCRFHHLDPRRWYVIRPLVSVIGCIAIDSVADSLLTSGAEIGVHQARVRAALKLGLDVDYFDRSGRRWRARAADLKKADNCPPDSGTDGRIMQSTSDTEEE